MQSQCQFLFAAPIAILIGIIGFHYFQLYDDQTNEGNAHLPFNAAPTRISTDYAFNFLFVSAATLSGSSHSIALFILANAQQSNAQWSQLSHAFPRGGETNQITGIWNNSFFMIGGFYHHRQLLEYDLDRDELIDHGQYYFSVNAASAGGQVFVQHNQHLYYLQRDKVIATFNVQTKTYLAYSTAVPKNNFQEYSTCLVKTKDHLVVSGGVAAGTLNDVFTFNIASTSWDNVYEPMRTTRRNHACSFVSTTNTIYAVGGNDGSNLLDTAEKLIISNPSNTWTLLEDTLTTPVNGMRALLYEKEIFIIGGGPDPYVDTVHSLDIEKDAITLVPQMVMPYAADMQGCASTEPPNRLKILCAGGWINGYKHDTIIQYVAPTSSPTTQPTKFPTNSPSKNPTTSPTRTPSHSPTHSPTFSPSISPTVAPTTSPSQSPTNPTLSPTFQPTQDPTQDPTIDPTQDPSVDPTQDPTSEPTLEPTTDPTQAPSDSPSQSPTSAPSTSPTRSPTAAPSTIAQLLKKYVDDKTYIDEINAAIYGTLFSIPSFCILTSVIIYKFDCIYNFVKSLFFRVDNQSYLSVILYFVQMTDMSSDIYFVYQLYLYHFEMKHGHIAVKDNVDKSTIDTVYYLFLSALAFTVIPYSLNFFSSIRIISNIATDNTINEYTKNYFKQSDKAYSIFTLLSGGSFYTLKLINSNFFGLRVFQAGMSKMMMKKYASHKIVLTTLLENVPQLLIQCIFVIKLRKISGTVIIASLSSVFNILLSVMSASIVNSTHKNVVEILFKINLSWTVKEKVDDAKDPYSMTGHRMKLSTALCNMETKNDFEFEILSSSKKDQTAAIYGVVKCNEKCAEREKKITSFFDEHLREAVMQSFGYNEDEFEHISQFDVDAVVGHVDEFVLSRKERINLSKIWNVIPWKIVKQRDVSISGKVIDDLTKKFEQFKDKQANKVKKSKGLLDVEQQPLVEGNDISGSDLDDFKEDIA